MQAGIFAPPAATARPPQNLGPAIPLETERPLTS